MAMTRGDLRRLQPYGDAREAAFERLQVAAQSGDEYELRIAAKRYADAWTDGLKAARAIDKRRARKERRTGGGLG